MKQLINLYFKYEEIINYLIVGFFTTLINLGTKYLLLFTIFDATNAYLLQTTIIISWLTGVIFAFICNKLFVFHSQSKKIFLEITTFIIGRILTLLLEMTLMWFFITFLKLNTKFYIIIFTVLCQIIVIIGNYLNSKFIVFKKKFVN